MRIIKREADRLNQLVSDFFDMLDQILLNSKVYRLQICWELILIFSYLQHGRDKSEPTFEYAVEIPKPDELVMQGDAKQLRQVFWNLLNNASQAMRDGGEVEIHGHRHGDEVTITIQDYGMGIQPQDMERIFDPFYSTKEAGTGLGLALVQRIVEDHGGRVLVDSTPDEGTRVSVVLPIRQPEIEEPSREQGVRR